jgi:hypothetical protein
MTTKEQEILAAIKEVEVEQKNVRSLVERYKRALLDAESDLIAANLLKEKLVEDLRVHRITTVKVEKSHRDLEIEAFRAKLPELLKKI